MLAGSGNFKLPASVEGRNNVHAPEDEWVQICSKGEDEPSLWCTLT
jgi:hypothetical protein